jgi:hypothetical protein
MADAVMHTIHQADLLAHLRGNRWLVQNGYIPKSHAILCDPPYGLEFMGKEWDKPKPSGLMAERDRYQARNDRRGNTESSPFLAAAVNKYVAGEDFQHWVTEWAGLLIDYVHPGALGLFFGGTRTYHRLAAGLEDAGWEVTDCIMWVTGQGFPKSHSLEKATDDPKWRGFGSALKPSQEPCVVCRAPRGKRTYAALAREFGTGALAIDAARIGYQDDADWQGAHGGNSGSANGHVFGTGWSAKPQSMKITSVGRWPANFALVCTCESDDHAADCPVYQIDNATVAIQRSFTYNSGNVKERRTCCEHASIAVKNSMLGRQTSNAVSESSVAGSADTSRRASAASSTQPEHWTNVPGAGGDSGAKTEVGAFTDKSKADGFGNSTTGQFQTDTTFTTSTKIRETTICPTCNALLLVSITLSTSDSGKITSWEWMELSADDASGAINTNRSVNSRHEQTELIRVTAPSVHGNISANGAAQTANTTTSTCESTDAGNGPSRFFYQAKAAAWEREAGLHGFAKRDAIGRAAYSTLPDLRMDHTQNRTQRANVHPTVKPIRLAEYLATLLLPPVLDEPRRLLVPFAGSGSEMIGALLAGWDVVTGIEREAEYVDLARARVGWWAQFATYDEARAAYEQERKGKRVATGRTITNARIDAPLVCPVHGKATRRDVVPRTEYKCGCPIVYGRPEQPAPVVIDEKPYTLPMLILEAVNA